MKKALILLIILSGCMNTNLKDSYDFATINLNDELIRFSKNEFILNDSNINDIEIKFEKYIKATPKDKHMTLLIIGYKEVDEHESITIARAESVYQHLIKIGYNPKKLKIKTGVMVFLDQEKIKNSLNQRVEIRLSEL